ncbi:stalk domain-containing protein [Alkalihalophilus pseudofirmus]|uniref:stalk domain-containing protein n=1 Tax=Alkalihalophilus pseudofirmus TaxID=79885 RepID=UPI00259B31F9|nr:stalk domain-containing protein [Alkalihalophilus pseudofirmus]WEG16675.1 stalk domain-containing protein [Alkalihalophilus pseudofirmus]
MGRVKLMFVMSLVMVLFLIGANSTSAQPVSVVLNGNVQVYDQQPVVENGRVLVPMRGIFESLGANVAYNNTTKKITATRGTQTVELTLGSRQAFINGQSHQLDVAAKAVNGRTIVPLRFVGEALGANVRWDNISKTVYISSGSSAKPVDPTRQALLQRLAPYQVIGDVNQISNTELEIFILTNEERQKHNRSPLALDVELSNVARIKSKDMHDVGYFAHNSPTYGTPFEMMDRFNISYRTAGENIAAGYTDAEQVTNGWINSPGHHRNMINDRFHRIGIGYHSGTKGYSRYYTQMFAGN